MPRKPRVNIMFLYVRETEVLDNIGGRALVIDTSVTRWKVAVDADAAARLRVALDEAFPAAVLSSTEGTPK